MGVISLLPCTSQRSVNAQSQFIGNHPVHCAVRESILQWSLDDISDNLFHHLRWRKEYEKDKEREETPAETLKGHWILIDAVPSLIFTPAQDTFCLGMHEFTTAL